MNPRERGFLLLSSHLGDPERRPLTHSQLRRLARGVLEMAPPEDRRLMPEDLMALGWPADQARQIWALLEQEQVLDRYLRRGKELGCVPLTRVSAGYPLLLRRRLGEESPGCLWAKGDLELLSQPAVALVGSRELKEPNERFAREVGRQVAIQGYVLVSGNARGADRTAQEACLEAGGSVICVVADQLWKHPAAQRVLYLSEEDFDQEFSAQRALSRNKCIHSLGLRTFVAQAGVKTGGTWDGTVRNLRHGWSDVFCYDDGSAACGLLEQLGAGVIGMEQLSDFYSLEMPQQKMDGM